MSDNAQDSEHTGQDGVGDRAGADLSASVGRLLFEIPAVQNFVAREATEIISRKLGTRISIDRVDIGLFYRVSLDGFYVEDFQRDTLLYAGRLDARIKSLGLFGGGLVFSRAELSDARFCCAKSRRGDEHQAGGR